MDGWVILFNVLFYLAAGFVVHVVICGDGSCFGVLFLGCGLERGIYVGFNLGNTALSPFSVLYLGMRYICLLCTLCFALGILYLFTFFVGGIRVQSWLLHIMCPYK